MPRSTKPPVPDNSGEDFEINIFKGLIKFTCKRITAKAIITLVIILLFVFVITKL